jgi:hypothetical protein
MKTCFAIMPFKGGFEDIDRIIADTAGECGLDYVRGDRQDQPGSILPQVLHHIRHAAVVVADITGHNPNVFYELGIAHQVKGPDRVVIITQSAEQSPYDVHEYRQLVYKHSEEGRTALREKLPAYLRAAADASTDQETWNVIRGRLSRTKLLVRDLQRLADSAGGGSLDNVTIRIVAGLGSLAISDREPNDPGTDMEYIDSLRAERDTLRNVLLLGAHLKGVLNPPRRFAKLMGPGRLRVRYERLIDLLEGRSDILDDPAAAAEDVAAFKRCEFALTPVPMPNLFIIGDLIAYEGMKRGGTGGYEMSHCETSAEGLRELIAQFDRLFDDSRTAMVQANPPDGHFADQVRAFYREAMEAERAGQKS